MYISIILEIKRNNKQNLMQFNYKYFLFNYNKK